jgi:hypothetical protein
MRVITSLKFSKIFKFKGFETTNELTWSFFSLVKRNLIYIK